MSDFSRVFMQEVIDVAQRIDADRIEKVAAELLRIREQGGRVFFLGVGGSAGNCSHAVNDFRKICGMECYAPTDNVSELTARTNDEGWESVFSAWLQTSRLCANDGVFVFSVGGGSVEKNISVNLVYALKLARQVGASILGVVGKDGGFTAAASENVVIIPTVNADHITPLTEAYQAVVWHLLVTHPSLKWKETKWESTK